MPSSVVVIVPLRVIVSLRQLLIFKLDYGQNAHVTIVTLEPGTLLTPTRTTDYILAILMSNGTITNLRGYVTELEVPDVAIVPGLVFPSSFPPLNRPATWALLAILAT